MAKLRAPGVRRLFALIHQAREPVFLLDLHGRFTYVNRAWEALTGYDSATILGRASAPPDDPGNDTPESSFRPPGEALEGRPSGGTTLIVRAGGERVWRRVEYWPYHQAEGGLLGVFGLVREADAPHHAPNGESQRARSELMEAREALRLRHGDEALIGRGPRHERLLDQIEAAAAARSPVMIIGETGTGRRTVGRMIHRRGPQSLLPLIPVDVAALTADRLEAELFAADAEGPPRLAQADRTTLLLHDAIALPRDVQARLAVALRDSTVRVLATASIEPEVALRQERFRPDLYYALTVLVLRLAPLRERVEELPILAQHALEQANRRGPRRRSGFQPEAMEAMIAYDWPGNLRELSRVVEAAHGRGETDLVAVGDLPAAVRGEIASSYAPALPPTVVTPLDQWLAQLERRMIEQALQRARQNKSRAAELLDISRPRLYRRIKELNIPDEGDPQEEAPAGKDER